MVECGGFRLDVDILFGASKLFTETEKRSTSHLKGTRIRTGIKEALQCLGTGTFKVMPLQQEAIYSLRILTACDTRTGNRDREDLQSETGGDPYTASLPARLPVMMIISKYCFGDMGDTAGNFMGGTRARTPRVSRRRLSSGISFLGAGVLLKRRYDQRG